MGLLRRNPVRPGEGHVNVVANFPRVVYTNPRKPRRDEGEERMEERHEERVRGMWMCVGVSNLPIQGTRHGPHARSL